MGREPLGEVEVEGRCVPIEHVWLEDGQLQISARERGPCRARSGRLSVRGADGVLICEGGHLERPAAGENTVRVIGISIDISNMKGGNPRVIQGSVIEPRAIC